MGPMVPVSYDLHLQDTNLMALLHIPKLESKRPTVASFEVRLDHSCKDIICGGLSIPNPYCLS